MGIIIKKQKNGQKLFVLDEISFFCIVSKFFWLWNCMPEQVVDSVTSGLGYVTSGLGYVTSGQRNYIIILYCNYLTQAYNSITKKRRRKMKFRHNTKARNFVQYKTFLPVFLLFNNNSHTKIILYKRQKMTYIS